MLYLAGVLAATAIASLPLLNIIESTATSEILEMLDLPWQLAALPVTAAIKKLTHSWYVVRPVFGFSFQDQRGNDLLHCSRHLNQIVILLNFHVAGVHSSHNGFPLFSSLPALD